MKTYRYQFTDNSLSETNHEFVSGLNSDGENGWRVVMITANYRGGIAGALQEYAETADERRERLDRLGES